MDSTLCNVSISALDVLHLHVHVLRVCKFLLHSYSTVESLRLKQVYSWSNWPANSLFRSTEGLNSTVHKSTAKLKGLWVTVTWRASGVQTVTCCLEILCSWSTVGIDTAGPASKGMYGQCSLLIATSNCSLLWSCFLSDLFNKYMHNGAVPYNNKLPAGCGYKYMKCNAIGHSQQPAGRDPREGIFPFLELIVSWLRPIPLHFMSYSITVFFHSLTQHYDKAQQHDSW